MTIENDIQQLQNLFESVNHSVLITDYKFIDIIKNDHYNELVSIYNIDESVIFNYLKKNKDSILEKKSVVDNLYFDKSGTKYKLHIEIKVFESSDEMFFVCFLSLDNIINNYLGKAKDSFSYISENSPFVVYICLNDKDWTTLYINEKIEDLTGYTKNEFLENKITFGQIFHEDDIDNIYDTVENALHNKESYNLNYRFIKKDGSIAYIEEHGSGIYHEDKLLFLQGNLLDITEKVLLEKHSFENQELYQKFFENSYTMMIIVDPDSLVIIEVNDALCQKYNYEKNHLIGKSLDIIHTNSFEQIKDSISKYFNSAKSAIIETKHRKRKGEIIDVEVFSSILKYKGSDTIFSIITDITDKKNHRKQIENEKERLSMFIDATQEGFWEINLNNKTTNANERYYNMFGYEKGEFPIKYDEKIEFVHPDDKIKYLNDIDNVIKNKTTKNTEYRVRHNDGHYVWVHSIGVVKTDDKGNIQSIIGATKDISNLKNKELQARNNALLYSHKNTELKKINVQLQKEIERAEESDRLKTSFLALLSHELRTPLNSISGFSSLIKYETDLEEIYNYADIISQSGTNLLDIINDLLDISNIEIKDVELNNSIFPANDIFEEIFDYMNQLMNNVYFNKIDQIEIVNEYKYSQENLMINSDKIKILKSLKNIANNAIKFTDKGKIQFGLNIYDNFIEFYFYDEGIGIDSDKLDSIFNAFTQSEGYLNREHGGLGLGLSIAKSYIKALKGHLLINSEKNYGTKVDIRLPRTIIDK